MEDSDITLIFVELIKAAGWGIDLATGQHSELQGTIKSGIFPGVIHNFVNASHTAHNVGCITYKVYAIQEKMSAPTLLQSVRAVTRDIITSFCGPYLGHIILCIGGHA